jgi:predicted GNAT superfamily acetyltransferase
MMSMPIVIRPITTPEQASRVVSLEATAWGMELSEAVPVHVLMAIAKNGGLLLGAYAGERLVGFTLGWLGTANAFSPGTARASEHLKLVSHLLGVLPEWRDRGVGYRLKLAQREWAVERGLDLVTWTYDPLESRNANLNLRRLGVTCQTYVRDIYGDLPDQMSVGIASDRFQVDWRITSERVIERLSASDGRGTDLIRASTGAQLLNPATLGRDGRPRPAERSAEPSGARLLVEIPADFQALRGVDLVLGGAWRSHTRAIFESAFAAGYRVVDLVYERDPSFPRSFYLLEKIGADS